MGVAEELVALRGCVMGVGGVGGVGDKGHVLNSCIQDVFIVCCFFFHIMVSFLLAVVTVFSMRILFQPGRIGGFSN